MEQVGSGDFRVESHVPEPSEVAWQDPRGRQRTVTLQWAVVDELVECVGFAVSEPTDGGPPEGITTSALRALKLAELIAGEKRRHFRERDGWLLDAPQAVRDELEVGDDLLRQMESNAGPFRPKVGRPKVHHSPDLPKVVAVYLDAVRAGGAPRLAVAEAFHVSDSQASRYIRSARAEGLLPPTSPGIASRSAGVPGQDGTHER